MAIEVTIIFEDGLPSQANTGPLAWLPARIIQQASLIKIDGTVVKNRHGKADTWEGVKGVSQDS